jgi:flagellar hook-basal body complex protein FliE
MNVSLNTSAVSSLAQQVGVSAPASGAGFADAISAAITNVEADQAQAQTLASDLLLNGKGDVHTVALAAQSADLSMELFQQVRNKFVAAYQEIMKMPI